MWLRGGRGSRRQREVAAAAARLPSWAGWATTVGGGHGACGPGGRARRGQWACRRRWACGPSAAQARSERSRLAAASAVTCGNGWWACQDLNLGPHPYQLNAGNRCAHRPFPRSRATVRAKGMRSISPLVCVPPTGPIVGDGASVCACDTPRSVMHRRHLHLCSPPAASIPNDVTRRTHGYRVLGVGLTGLCSSCELSWSGSVATSGRSPRHNTNVNGSRCVGCALGSWGTRGPLTVYQDRPAVGHRKEPR